MAEGEPQPASAANQRIKQDLADRFAPRIMDIRNRRRTLDEEDLRAHAAWRGVRQRFFYDSDTFKNYVPLARQTVERFAVRVVQLLFPLQDPFEVYPGDEISLVAGKQADAVRAYMDHLVTTKLKLRRVGEQLVRSLLLYKRAIIKNGVRVIDVPVTLGGKTSRLRQIWPTCRAVDTFAHYVWPETAADPEDAILFFEDIVMPWGDYLDAVERKVADRIDRAELTEPQWPYWLVARLSIAGLTTPTTTGAAGYSESQAGQSQQVSTPKPPFVELTEIWFRSGAGWCQAWLVWNVAKGPRCVRFHPSMYPEPPYRMAVARSIPGEHYTNGLMQDLEPLNIWFNDLVNQSEENRAVSGLPPTLVNVQHVSRADSLVYGPRKKWLVDDVQNAVKQMEIADTSGTSQRAMQIVMGLINSMGPSPLVQGQPMRNIPRAGFAVQNIANMSMADIQEVAQILETEIFTPSMTDWFRATLSFVPRTQILAIPGTQAFPPQTITVDDLFGNWAFKWVGSMQAQAQQMKAQQMLVAMQGAAKLAPILAQQGWAINWGVWVKRWWRDALGERGTEQIIVPITELQNVNPAAAALIQAQVQAQLATAQNAAQGGPPGPQPGGGLPVGSPQQADAQTARQLATPSTTQQLSPNGTG